MPVADPALKLAQRITAERLRTTPPSEWAMVKATLPGALLPLCRALIACREALRKVEEIQNSDAVQSIYTIAKVHGHEYKGPMWGELVAAALAQADEVIGGNK